MARLHIIVTITAFMTLLSKTDAALKPPKLTVVIVIDQFAYHELQKLHPYLKGGIRFLNDHGINYTNVFHPHGMPETGTGHTTISTGALAREHGIIGNRWYHENGKLIDYDDDKAETSRVFAPDNNLYPFGKSPKRIMVDTLSDQIMLQSSNDNAFKVFSLSLKSRAAIAMAGRLGKALWLDEKSGFFTSSQSYFDMLPAWVNDFNKGYQMDTLRNFKWDLKYPESDSAYNFVHAQNYKFTPEKETIIGKTLHINPEEKDPFEYFQKTPLANKYLMDFAQYTVDKHVSNNPQDHLMLWLSLSGLDKVGHSFGPYSEEVIDMIYHIDQNLQQFINFVYEKVDPKEVLFVLTADHGIRPVIEILREHGLEFANRHKTIDILKDINQYISLKHSIPNLIENFTMPSFYLNKKLLTSLDTATKDKIIADVKNYITTIPGIAQVWTYDELEKLPLKERDTSTYYKNQLYKGRTGDLIIKVMPYNFIDPFLDATTHGSPYDYDTHVPLMLYQKNRFEQKTITQWVDIPQLSVTLATLLNVPRPSASTSSPLPLIP
jgi:predicted AlkP superfamily pyrophosphatase or phosphodiesterase